MEMKTKTKIMIAAMALACSFGAAGVCMGRQATALMAEPDEESTIAESQEPAEDQSQEESQWESIADEEELAGEVQEAITKGKDWLNEKWNTFVAPLIGGVSLGTVLLFIANLVLNYRKGHKAEAKYQEAIAKLAESNAINEEAKKALAELKEVAEKTMEAASVSSALKENADKVAEIVAEQGEALKKAEPILRLLTQLTIKVAEASGDLAKSGLIEDVKEIERLLKEF